MLEPKHIELMATPAEKWTDAALSEMRSQGDPLADDTVATVFAQGDLARVNQLLTSLIRNDQVPRDDLPPSVQEYFRQTAAVPEPDG